MKRILSLLLSALLVLSAFPGVVFASDSANVTIAGANGNVGETISLQVKLNTSTPVDSIALRDLVYNSEALEFLGFDDYSALENNFALNATVKDEITYISIALKDAVKFDSSNENLCTLKFKVLSEEEANVSLTAIVKADKTEIASSVIPGKVNEVVKMASVTVADGTAKIGETLSLPVKLSTTTAVDSIALRDFEFNSEILEFESFDFTNTSITENLKALEFTTKDDPIYASMALNTPTVFDASNENIVSLTFKVLGAGSTQVKFNAVVKNDAEEIDAIVDAGDVVTSNPTVEVTSVSFDVTEKEVTEGDSFTIKADIEPGDATVTTLTWTSDNQNVASVDQSGKVTAVGEGQTVITATAASGAKAECTVKVNAKPVPKSASFALADQVVNSGDTFKIPVKLSTTTAVDSIAIRDLNFETSVLEFVGFDFSMTSISEEMKALEFTALENPAYASIALKAPVVFDASNEDIVLLTFKAIEDGSSEVTFTPVVKNDKEEIDATAGTATVTVNPVAPSVIPVTGITLNSTTAEVTAGDVVNLTAAVTPADTTEDKGIIWTTSDETVATVADGVVTTLKDGEVTITATSKANAAIKAECKIKVNKKVVAVTGITLDKTTAEVTEGEKVTLVATVVPEDTTEDKGIIWTTSDETVATVADGVVTTLKDGEVTITATSKANADVKATCVITVVAKPVVIPNEASFVLEGGNVKAGDTISVPVKLTTTKEVDSIAIRDLVYDNTVLEFVDFVDYEALQQDSWAVTKEEDMVYISTGLNTARKFDGEKIVALKFKAIKEGSSDVNFTAIVKNDTVGFDEDVNTASVTVEPNAPVIEPKEASFVIEGSNVKVDETISVPVKLTTSDVATSIAIRDLVYDNTVLEFVDFVDYEALQQDSWAVTKETEMVYISTGLNAARKFDGEKIVALKFKAIKEGSSDVSFTAIVKNDTVDFDEDVNTASVTVEPKPVTGTAAFALSNEQIRVGETAKVKVELNTTAAVDSITIKNLDYDETEVEFIGFGDYNGLDNWTITPGTETVTLTAPLNTAKKFVFEKILTLEFKALKKGLALINFDAVVKNGTSEFKVTDNADGSINVLPAIVRVTEVIIENKPAKVTEGDKFELTATVNPSGATNKDVVWESSNPEIATVGSVNGNVEALKSGEVTITATADGVSTTWTFTVEPKVIRIPGDADDDKDVDIMDALAICRYKAEYNITINMSNANVDGDDDVDIMDALTICRYKAEYDVTLK